MRSNSGARAQSGLSGSLAASTQSLFPSSILSDMSLYTFIGGFRGLAKQEGVAIDNDVFRLHYRYTVCLLALCSGLLTANQFFGNPMTCHMRGEVLPERMVTNYCWVTGTYTLKHINKPVVRQLEDLSDGEKQFVRRFVSGTTFNPCTGSSILGSLYLGSLILGYLILGFRICNPIIFNPQIINHRFS